jgi:hypothetical protein
VAFKQVEDLNPDTVVSLGGSNRKTGKKNPDVIEGYYLGKRVVSDPKKKSGQSFIYVLRTAKGDKGVWGKTDMDRKMGSAVVGAMLRISHTGMATTPNGEMYKYKVEIDTDNTIEVTGAVSASEPNTDEGYAADISEIETYSDEDTSEDEDQAQQLALAAAERKAKTLALLNRNKKA